MMSSLIVIVTADMLKWLSLTTRLVRSVQAHMALVLRWPHPHVALHLDKLINTDNF